MLSARALVSSIVAAAVAVLAMTSAASAATYPTNTCVSSKLKAAAGKCKDDLNAWSKWNKSLGLDDMTRDEKLLASATKFSDKWGQAEDKSTSKGVDCADTTLSLSGTAAIIDAAVNDIVTEINTGLNLANGDEANCGAALIKAAAKKCQKFLQAESKLVKKLAKGTDARDATQSDASAAFTEKWNDEVAGCPTTATLMEIEDKIDQLNEDVVTNMTVSPNVPTSFTMITPSDVEYEGQLLHPICSRNTPYVYFVKRGTVNKLLVYYQGGGACWDPVTCADATGAFKDEAGPGDNPSLATTGFADMTNPANPFKDWNAVFISYCTGDVHWGDNKKTYIGGSAFGNFPIEHRGYVNAKVVEKFAREHFVNPEEVFVTGSSAGAYGAILHGLLLPQVYGASHFDVLGDAGNGVITQVFLSNYFEQAWHVQQHLPTFIPGLDEGITNLSIVDLWANGANFYPQHDFAQYTSAFDGGGGSQTFFYSVMVDGIPDGLSWWNQSCNWNATMKQYALDTVAATATPTHAGNYRYYISSGSRHTMWGSNKVYSDLTGMPGGSATIVGFINQMLTDDPGWSNEECTTCNALPGACSGGDNDGETCQDDSDCPGGTCSGEDARPSPLAAPFEPGGVINCP